MTDEERLHDAHCALNAWQYDRAYRATDTTDATLARIRTLLAEPLPSVEWDENAHASVGRVEGGGRLIVLTNETGMWSCRAWLNDERSTTADSWRLPTRDAAKARALALYVALRGVT